MDFSFWLILKKLLFDKLTLITREKGSIKEEKDVLEWKKVFQINLI